MIYLIFLYYDNQDRNCQFSIIVTIKLLINLNVENWICNQNENFNQCENIDRPGILDQCTLQKPNSSISIIIVMSVMVNIKITVFKPPWSCYTQGKEIVLDIKKSKTWNSLANLAKFNFKIYNHSFIYKNYILKHHIFLWIYKKSTIVNNRLLKLN